MNYLLLIETVLIVGMYKIVEQKDLLTVITITKEDSLIFHNDYEDKSNTLKNSRILW